MHMVHLQSEELTINTDNSGQDLFIFQRLKPTILTFLSCSSLFFRLNDENAQIFPFKLLLPYFISSQQVEVGTTKVRLHKVPKTCCVSLLRYKYCSMAAGLQVACVEKYIPTRLK